MHQNSFELFKQQAACLFLRGMDVLELGASLQWERDLVQSLGCNYHFADIRNHYERVPGFIPMKGLYSIQSEDDRFDIVFSLNVAEHVPALWTWIAEQVRVTKPGGYLVFVNPVSWPYHEAPIDCWRILPEGYRSLFQEAGLWHVHSWHGTLVELELSRVPFHGPHRITDTIAIAQKPIQKVHEEPLGSIVSAQDIGNRDAQ